MRRNFRPATALALLLFAGLSILVGCKSAWVSSGILYTEQANYKKANVMYETALWYNPDDADAHYFLGFLLQNYIIDEHIEASEWDSATIKMGQATDHLLRSAELKPDEYGYNPDAEEEVDERPVDNAISSAYARAFNSAVRSNQSGEIEEAAHYFQLAEAADPRGERGFNARMSYVQLRLNQALDGEEINKDLVNEMLALLEGSEAPDNASRADLAKTKAQALRMVDRDAEAKQLYEDLLREFPDDVPLLQRVAEARIQAGDPQGAAELYGRIVMVINDNVLDYDAESRFRYTAGAMQAYEAIDDMDRALELAQAALGLASGDDQRLPVMRRQAQMHYEMENYEEVLKVVDAIIVISDTEGLAWQLKYLALSRLQRTDEALAARERYRALQGG